MNAAGERSALPSGVAADPIGAMSSTLPQVWVFQPAVKHYRLPLWDQLVEQAQGRYQLSVFGPLEIEQADIDRRPYLRQMPLHRRFMLGREVAHWGGAARMIRRGKPQVVVLTATVSFFGSWSLPRIARREGAAVVGWSKVNSRAGHTTWLERQVKRTFFRRFDLFICYGQRSREELESLGYPADRIRVAQNTIDTRRIFSDGETLVRRGAEIRSQLGLQHQKILLCIGRMVPQKRQADLITAWMDLRQTDPNLVLVFVGSGPLYEGLKAAAFEADPDRIIFTGPVPEGDDYAWIATSDLVVMPGAVGLALNQAMALARVTVIADEPGADAELMCDGQSGYRYPRGDIQALVNIVRQALQEPAEAQRRAEAARQLIAQKATIEHMVNTLNHTLLEALQLGRPLQSNG